jgi:hypothetical protein
VKTPVRPLLNPQILRSNGEGRVTGIRLGGEKDGAQREKEKKEKNRMKKTMVHHFRMKKTTVHHYKYRPKKKGIKGRILPGPRGSGAFGAVPKAAFRNSLF